MRIALKKREKPYIMGVVNCTPDSFSDGGLYLNIDKAYSHAMELIEEGADILDIGGESTRPFSEPVPAEEEIKRTIPLIRRLRKRTDVLLSIDTQKYEVARLAISEGVDIINDISALRRDANMINLIKEHHIPVCLMHMKGTPQNMQLSPTYTDCVGEVYEFLEERLLFLEQHDISRNLAIIDPGVGFGKLLEHNLLLLANIKRFKGLGAMVLVGVSRKSFLGAITGIEEPIRRDIPTLGAVAWSVLNGTDIVRVHNVRWTAEMLKVIEAIRDFKDFDEFMKT